MKKVDSIELHVGHVVTVEITPVGSPPQTPSKDRLTHHIVRIGPVPLDIRPLSDYQQSLIDTILSLKFKG